MADANVIPPTLLSLNRSIAAADAFRLQPSDPASWTQVGATAVWWATYPTATEMPVKRAPDVVYYSAKEYVRVGRLVDCVTVGTWFYDVATRKLYLCTGADPSTNVVCYMLQKGMRAFKLKNPMGNTQIVDWAPGGATPASGVGEELQPVEDSGVIPYCDHLRDILIKARGADADKVISALLWVE